MTRKQIARQAAGKIADWLCDFGPLLIVLAVYYVVYTFAPLPQP